MPRFFKEYFENSPYIEGNDALHIAKSLRMRKGECLTVCDTKGFDYSCIISAVSDQRIELEIREKTKTKTEPSVFVTLYQCLPKGDKMDLVVRQAIECGVCRIVPVLSSNCVSRPDQKALEKKCERWQKIANEAAGQCGRGILPKVDNPLSLKQVAKAIENDDKSFFCYELGGKPFESLDASCSKLSVIIGPEGGFTLDEATLLQTSGAIATTLGPRILRTETAPLVALTAIMLCSKNME